MAEIKTIADIEVIEAVPLAERNLDESTYAFFQRLAKSHPNHNAMRFFLQAADYQNSVDFTFKDMLAKITQTANLFHSLGVGPTDSVSYLMPNLPQTYFTLYGGEAAGIANPINFLLEPDTVAEIMNAAKSKVLVTIAPFPKTEIWENAAKIVNKVPTLETILQVDIAGYLSGVKKLAVKAMRLGKGSGDIKAKVLNFDKELAKQPSDRLISGRQISSDEIAAYFHTGGTTGTPKLAQHTHANQVFDAWAVSTVVDGQPGDFNFLGLPLFHNYGAIAIGLGSWNNAGGVVMATPAGYRGEGVLENLWEILAHYKCALVSGVPTVYSTLLNLPTGNHDLSNLRTASCGAAPLPVEVARQFTEKTGVNILEGYGLTEGTSVNSVNPAAGEPRIGSVGLRLPYEEMRTAIVEDNKIVRFGDVNEVGVIVMRGPNIFPGYKDDFHNKSAFLADPDGDEKWMNTGDMGRMDEDEFFWLTGRKKELIIRGGHNIDPKLIEEPMHRHPAVALAAAVGRPDAHSGEVPVAYVELKPGETATTEELLAFAKENIGERAAVPKQVYILDAIPQTAVGKIFKPTLTHEQVVDVFKTDLDGIDGIASSNVVAEGDKRLGTVAHVTVQTADGADKNQVEQAVTQALGRYPIHHDVKVS